MSSLIPLILKVSLLTFLISGMLGMGMGLTLRTLLAPLRDTRLVLVALAINFVAAPALAWLLTAVIPLQRPHAMGLLLLACAAGAPFLPKLVETARGDVALSVALMTLLTVGTTLFMPFALPLLVPGLAADPWAIARPLLELILLPLVIGLVLRRVAPGLSARCQPWLAKLTNVSIVLVLAAVIARDFRSLLGVVGSGAILAAILYVAGLFVLGYVLGGPRAPTRGVQGLGAAARNIGAAMVPASLPSTDPQVVTMLVVTTLVLFVVLLGAAAWLRRQAPQSPTPQPHATP